MYKPYNSNVEVSSKGIFDIESKSDFLWVGEVGVEGAETKAVCQTVKWGKMQKKQPSTQCRACGTINISNYVNNLSKNPTALILSSLEKEFW